MSQSHIGTGVIYYLIAGIISAVVSFVINMIFSTATGGAAGAVVAGLSGIFGIIVIPIITVILSFIIVGIYFILAKILGGTGSYSSLFYLMSLYAIPVGILSSIPILGILAALYGLYLAFLAIKESQQLSTGKAIIPIIIMIILTVILIVIVGVAFWSLLVGSSRAGIMG